MDACKECKECKRVRGDGAWGVGVGGRVLRAQQGCVERGEGEAHGEGVQRQDVLVSWLGRTGDHQTHRACWREELCLGLKVWRDCGLVGVLWQVLRGRCVVLGTMQVLHLGHSMEWWWMRWR